MLGAGLLVLASACLAEPPAYQHGISLLHDLKYPADFTHFDYSNPLAPKGGSLTLSASWPVRNVSGAWGTAVPSAAGIEQTMDRLFVRSADEPSALYGLLVDGVALSDDRRSLFLRLHKDARWHDGVPVTTADLRFSYDALMASATHERFNMKAWVASFDVVNDRELVIRHRDVFTHTNLLALSSFAVRPAHYYAGHEDGDPFKPTLRPPLANGPYRVATFDSNHIVYERVPDYWGRDLPVNRGRFNFDTIRYDIYRDATVAREAFRKGLFDALWESDARHWQAASDLEPVKTGAIRRDSRRVARVIGLELALAFNLDQPRFQDLRVREALTLAYNFDWQNRVFHYDSQIRALSYFAGSKFAASGLPSPEERAVLLPFRHQLPDRIFSAAFDLPSAPGQGLHREALARAGQLLKESGWELVDGQRRDREGRPFRLEIATQDGGARRKLLAYVDSLKMLGIDARIRLLDNALAVNYKRKRQYDLYLRQHDLVNPPLGQLHTWFSTASAEMMMGGIWRASGTPSSTH